MRSKLLSDHKYFMGKPGATGLKCVLNPVPGKVKGRDIAFWIIISTMQNILSFLLT